MDSVVNDFKMCRDNERVVHFGLFYNDATQHAIARRPAVTLCSDAIQF